MINEQTVLEFDPEQALPIIKEIFDHPIAHVLWLGIKGTHLVDQHFNDHCLELGKIIERWIAKRNLWEIAQGKKRRPGRPPNEPRPVTGRLLSMALEN